MSQKTELRISALESELSTLAQRVSDLEGAAPETGWKAVHHGFGRWRAESFDGTPLGSEWFSKDEATIQAAEMNAALEGAEVA